MASSKPRWSHKLHIGVNGEALTIKSNFETEARLDNPGLHCRQPMLDLCNRDGELSTEELITSRFVVHQIPFHDDLDAWVAG